MSAFGDPTKGLCQCGHPYDPVDWCEADRDLCSPTCPAHGDTVACVMISEKLRCPRCEIVVEAQE